MATWWNSKTQLRLDMAVCTPAWFDLFGHSKLLYLQSSDSDHVPILFRASTISIASKTKFHRFKFETFWVQHPECAGVVSKDWRADITGTPMFYVTKKIAHTRRQLDKWQKQVFRIRQLQMLGIQTRLDELLDVSISEVVQQEKQELMGRLHTLLYQEESFWRWRFKVTWLKKGDRDTGFFHWKAQNRRRKNRLQGLFDENG
ncbi:uncharacterized protein LOC112198879 [Rosa chinensis]|uniref:uncharacterized protein LOC112198879 n=1 Tax=Rosa chinensis TaxID=74649 RepID=UPI000D08DA8F|nr:uncharacterized protein LOC112198879 [Rosa chinensis]